MHDGIDLPFVVQHIKYLIMQYTTFNKEPPNYVMIPRWLESEFRENRKKMLGVDFEASTLCGLKVCPTISIESVYEIEVF